MITCASTTDTMKRLLLAFTMHQSSFLPLKKNACVSACSFTHGKAYGKAHFEAETNNNPIYGNHN